MTQPHATIDPSRGSADDDYADGYADGVANAPQRADGEASAAGGAAAAERYRHGYWHGQQDRKHHRLELRDDGRGGRYYLDGRPIHNGDQLEIQLADGEWRGVRLEGLPAEILGYGLLPALAGGLELVAKVPLRALFRWAAPAEPR